jgi:hypothetical protein
VRSRPEFPLAEWSVSHVGQSLPCPKSKSISVKPVSSAPRFYLTSPKDAPPTYTLGFKCDSCGITASTPSPRFPSRPRASDYPPDGSPDPPPQPRVLNRQVSATTMVDWCAAGFLLIHNAAAQRHIPRLPSGWCWQLWLAQRPSHRRRNQKGAGGIQESQVGQFSTRRNCWIPQRQVPAMPTHRL